MNLAGIAEFILGNSEYSMCASAGANVNLYLSVPNGGLPHLWQSLGQSRIHSRSHSPDYVSVLGAWWREWRSIQLVSRLPQRHDVSTLEEVDARPPVAVADLEQGYRKFRLLHGYLPCQCVLHIDLLRAHHALLFHRRGRLPRWPCHH